MKLIFGALAIFVTAMVLLAGSGVFWLSSSALEQSKQESVKNLANSLAYSVSSQMQLLEKTVEQMAGDAEVIAAIESGDTSLIDNTGNKLQQFLPMALKIRLLPANINSVDERQVPFMGYADLEMVKKTITAKQQSIIQGAGVNRHLAITAIIKKDNQVIGVVLASLKFDFLKELMSKAPVAENFIEITQDTVSLGAGGNTSQKNNNPQQFPIAKTPWNMSYAVASEQGLSSLAIIIGIVVSFAVLACLALFFGYYYLTGLLKKDQDTVLEVIKNMMTGKELGTYELKLNEMQVIISTLVQFKRIIDNKSGKEELAKQSKNINFDDILAVDDEEKDSPEVIKTGSGLFKKKTSANL